MNKLLLTLSFFAAICTQTLYAQGEDELLSETEMNTDAQIFVFTKEPLNPNFKFSGESVSIEGKLIAENTYSNGQVLYFAIQREEFNDILITSVSLNLSGEVEHINMLHITEEQSKDLDFGVLTTDEKLDISINFDTFLSVDIDHDNEDVVERKINGILIGNFKTKEALEDFKLFLRRN